METGLHPISLSIDGAVAIATLSQPPVNALDDAWVTRLDAILDELERNERLSVLWLRSDQRVFCAGADLEFMRARFPTPEGRAQMIAFTRRLQAVYARLERISQVTIAEIGGAALGGGFELALSCDLRLAADTAKIGLPEARLGLLPAGGGTQRLTRLCGAGIARRLILGAEIVTGSTAAALGLVQWVLPAEELEAASRTLVGKIAELPAMTLSACKACIAAAVDGSDGYELELVGSERLLGLADTQQRVQRFLDKST